MRDEADHGESFVPGAGPERMAPKSMDHFQRGYRERADQRDKEGYTKDQQPQHRGPRRGPPRRGPPRGEEPWNNNNNRTERPTILQGFNVLEFLDLLTEYEHDRRKVFDELDRARAVHAEPFENGKALTALISSAARRRNVHMAGLIWSWMDVAKVDKNTFHYNSMISATEKSRNYRQALALMREMEKRNIPKNEVTYVYSAGGANSLTVWILTFSFFALQGFQVPYPRVKSAENGALPWIC